MLYYVIVSFYSPSYLQLVSHCSPTFSLICHFPSLCQKISHILSTPVNIVQRTWCPSFPFLFFSGGVGWLEWPLRSSNSRYKAGLPTLLSDPSPSLCFLFWESLCRRPSFNCMNQLSTPALPYAQFCSETAHPSQKPWIIHHHLGGKWMIMFAMKLLCFWRKGDEKLPDKPKSNVFFGL